jgi:pyrophosphatase PpaX
MRNCNAVGFDLDGTLIDSKPCIVASLQATFRELNVRIPSPDEIRATVGLPWVDMLRRLGFPDKDAEAWRQAYNIHFARLAPSSLRAFPGVTTVLLHLKGTGKKLALVTSRGNDTVEVCLRQTGIDPALFDVIVDRESTQKHKPSPDPILEACRQLQVETCDFVYVGDADVDMQAAAAAGAWGIFAAYGSEGDCQLANDPRVIGVINELSGLENDFL